MVFRWDRVVPWVLGRISYHKTKNNFEVKDKFNIHQNAIGVISTSLFGDFTNKRYVTPLLQNAHDIKKILPGWVLRVYVSPSIPKYLIQQFIDLDIEIVIMLYDSKGLNGTLWRFLPAGETKPFLSFDADELIKPKVSKRLILDEISLDIHNWLKSDKPFFQRRLGLFFNSIIPLSAGTWGAKPLNDGKPIIPDIQSRLEKYDAQQYGEDEAFLSIEIHPLFKHYGVYIAPNRLEVAIVSAIFTMAIVQGISSI